MKKETALKLLLIAAFAFISVRLVLDFDPALLLGTICLTLYVIFSRENRKK